MEVGVGAYPVTEVRETREEILITDCMHFAKMNPGGKKTNKPGYKPIPILGPKKTFGNAKK